MNDVLQHYNLNHDPETGQFTEKMSGGSLLSRTDKLLETYGKESIDRFMNDSTKELVTRWGRNGLKNGDWVMKGDNSVLNYVLSAKWQVGLGNQYASKSSGKTYVVNKGTLRNPSGFGIDGGVKALFRQKRYYTD